MKYILVHEDTCALAIMQTTPSYIEEITIPASRLHILKQYPDTIALKKYHVYGINEDGRSWDGFIYSSANDVCEIFHMLYPNDEYICCVEYEI